MKYHMRWPNGFKSSALFLVFGILDSEGREIGEAKWWENGGILSVSMWATKKKPG